MSMKERTPCNDDEKEASSGDERSVNMDALLRSEMSEVIESDAGIGCDGIGGRGGGGDVLRQQQKRTNVARTKTKSVGSSEQNERTG